jgi:hypothetical protein
MQPKSAGLAVRTLRYVIEQATPDPLPKPPSRPPGEPIIIKDPSRQPDAPEVDRPLDREEEEEDAEIRRPPANIPEMPPPPTPDERAR